MPLTPLPTTEPELLTLPELGRLADDLASKGTTPYKARVGAELLARLDAASVTDLAIAYEALCPAPETHYKARVRHSLERRLRHGKDFADGEVYRFAVDQAGDLVKVPKPTAAGITRMVHSKPTKWPRKRPPGEATARFAGARHGDRKIAATDTER